MSKGVRIVVAVVVLACVAAALAIPAVRSRVIDPLLGETKVGGRPVSAWAMDLYSNDIPTRRAAQDALDQVDHTAWTHYLNHPDGRVRLWAVEQKFRQRVDPQGLDPETRQTVLALYGFLKDPSSIVRQKAAYDLRSIPQQTYKGIRPLDPIIADLVSALHDDAVLVRRGAASVLAMTEVAKEAGSAVPALTEATGDADAAVRANAARALGEIGSKASGSVGSLQKLLGDKDEEVRAAAVTSLAQIDGPEAKHAIPELQRLAKSDKSDGVREAATVALEKLQPQPAPAPGK